MRFPTYLALCTVCTLLLTLKADADLLVVDSSGAGDFPDLPIAVAAAQSGDVLLVRSGIYSGFTLESGSLTVVADEGADVVVQGTLRFQQLASVDRVVLAGLDIRGDVSAGGIATLPGAVQFADSGAQVRIQDCVLTGGSPSMPDDLFTGCGHSGDDHSELWGGPGLELVGSGKVALVDCAIAGGKGGTAPFCFIETGGRGGDGVLATASQVALSQALVTAGDGGTACDTSGGGGVGARLVVAVMSARSSSLVGGDAGGINGPLPCWIGGGGDGVRVSSGSLAWLSDSTYVGGSAGFGANTFWPGGEDGGGLVVQGVANELRVVPPTRTSTANVARASSTYALTVTGTPQSQVFLLRSHTPIYLWKQSWSGLQLVSGISDLPHAQLGRLPDSGTRTFTLAVPALAPGAEHDVIYTQIVMKDPLTGQTVAGPPHTLVVVKP